MDSAGPSKEEEVAAQEVDGDIWYPAELEEKMQRMEEENNNNNNDESNSKRYNSTTRKNRKKINWLERI